MDSLGHILQPGGWGSGPATSHSEENSGNSKRSSGAPSRMESQLCDGFTGGGQLAAAKLSSVPT